MAIHNQSFYKTSFKKHGVSARGLSWNSKESQEIRFEILTSFLGALIPTCSIVDAGCGFGDLYIYLQKKKLIPKSYIGIDSFEQFITIANQRVASVAFLQRDILKDALPRADWYIASGSLNILSDFETWFFLEQMLHHAHKGIIFNILCGEKKSAIYNYKMPKELEDFANKKQLTCKIITGYMQADMSVMFRKDITKKE